MIFVTVGTQGAFDRLIRTIDEWASRSAADVFAQVGPARYVATHIKTKPFVHPAEFRTLMERADLVVAHAGMGSILTALEYGKRIVVMPRRADLFEHRTDHQVATARQFAAQGHVDAAFSEAELCAMLDGVRDGEIANRLSPMASPALIDAIRSFIDTPETSPRARR